MFSDDVVLFLVVFGLTIGLGIFIFSQDKKNKLHKSFLFLSFAIAIWVFSNYMEDAVFNQNFRLFLLKLDFAFAVVMAYAFLDFCINFSNKYIKIKKIKIYNYVFFISATLFSLLTFFSNKIIAGATFVHRVIDPIYGQLYPPYLAFILVIIVVGTFFLILKYKNEDSVARKQTVLVITGFILMIIVMLITSVILTLFSEDSPNFLFYSRLSIYSVLFLIGFMSYAIAKNNFLNIRIITAQIFSYAMVLIFFLEILTSQTIQTAYLRIFLFLLVLYFARMIVSYVKAEVQRKNELQLMSDKLAQANDQLRKLDNAKSEFISIASHQLRTPLTAIKGFMSLLLEGSYGKLDPKQEDVLNKVYQSNERLINLVEDLLNISRIESGRMEFTFDKWKMEDICKEVIDTFVLKAKDKGFYLEYNPPKDPLPELLIDGLKVREVVSNLVDNAIKYTKKGGVRLKVELIKGPQQKVPGLDGAVRVTVSDTGIGIPATELPYLFAKFSRGKDTSRLNTGGTGLGLYVGKSMIENNGGMIWAESDGDGKGSRFIIELPVKYNPPEWFQKNEQKEKVGELIKQI